MADYSADDFTNGVNTALIEDREMWKEKGSAGREGKGKITEYGEIDEEKQGATESSSIPHTGLNLVITALKSKLKAAHDEEHAGNRSLSHCITKIDQVRRL